MLLSPLKRQWHCNNLHYTILANGFAFAPTWSNSSMMCYGQCLCGNQKSFCNCHSCNSIYLYISCQLWPPLSVFFYYSSFEILFHLFGVRTMFALGFTICFKQMCSFCLQLISVSTSSCVQLGFHCCEGLATLPLPTFLFPFALFGEFFVASKTSICNCFYANAYVLLPTLFDVYAFVLLTT